MTINFLKFKTPDEIRSGAKLALKNRLFVSGWEMSHFLKDYIECSVDELKPIVIAMCDKVPIGCLMLYGNVYSIFVRKAYRRQGIGTALMKEMNLITDVKDYVGDSGIHGSGRFFESAGVIYTGSPRYY